MADLDSLLAVHYAASVLHQGDVADAVAAMKSAFASDPVLADEAKAKREQLDALANTCGGEGGLAQRSFVSAQQLKALSEALI